MQKYQDVIQDVHGNAIPDALVTVYVYNTLTLATIYSDNGLTIVPSSIVTTDSDGQFFFYADNGRYTLSISATNFAADRVSRLDQVTAGTTFTRTNRFNLSGGGAFTLDCVDNSNVLAVQLFAASARSNVRLVAFFNGTCAIAP